MRPQLFPILFGNNFSLNAQALINSWTLRDYTKTDDQFQESTGPTPTNTAGQAIGLKLDRGLWGGQTLAQTVASATQRNSNPGGPFINTTGYSAYASAGTAPTLSVVSGRLRITHASDTQFGKAVITMTGLTVGKTYNLSGVADNGTGNAIFRVTLSSTGLSSSATEYDGTEANMLFVAVATTMYLALINNIATGSTYVEFESASIKLVPGYSATQPTSGNKPTWQTGGVSRYDSIDDYHSQSRTFAASGFVLLRANLIAAAASTRVVFGSVGAAGTDRGYCGHDASGYPLVRIGNGAQMSVSTDRTGIDGTLGFWWDGSLAKMILDGDFIQSQTQVSAPTTTIAPTIGGYNNNGTPSLFANFDLKAGVMASNAPSQTTIKNVHRALMAL